MRIIVKKDATIQELRAAREELLKSMRFSDVQAGAKAPAVLKQVDEAFARDLFGGVDLPWADEGLFPESARVMADVKRLDDGQRVALLSDLEILRKVKESGADQSHRAALGFLETVFPVRLHDKVVHLVWSGKMRDKAFSADEIAELSKLSGLSKAEAEEHVRAIPVLTKRQVERALAFCGRFRDSLERALAQHVHAAKLTRQLLDSERTHSVGTLSGGVAHHFNNLLSVILGYSSFVLNREKLSQEAAGALHKITEAAQKGRRLTEEILAFLGSDAEEEAPCSVHDTVESVLSLLESRTAAGVRVEKKLEAAHPTVTAPPSAIRQIIFNLLTNAMDSIAAGGLLSVTTSNTHMAAESGRQEYIRLEVADSGGGLPEAARAFTSGGGVLDLRAAGDRLGFKLSSVYGMVGRLDGTVVVSSEPGSLTKVQILLPTAQAGEEEQEQKRVRRRLAPSCIWVVDDDAIFREMCRQVLSDDGHEVRESSGGREFMEMWRKGGTKPDLIVMDFSMPEYNGLQLCEWLRGEGARVPVILVSGFAANQPDIKKALKMKKTFFLQKPFSFREMADTVTVALGETLIGE